MKYQRRICAALIGVAVMLSVITFAFLWLNTPLRAVVIVPFEDKDAMEEILSESGVSVRFPSAGRFGSAVGEIDEPSRLRNAEDRIFHLVAQKGFFCRVRYVKKWKRLNNERSIGDSSVIGLGAGKVYVADEAAENSEPANFPLPMEP